MDFEEAMNGLTSGLEEGSDMTPYDNIRAAYNERVSAGDAKVSELEAANAELTSTNTSLRAHYYDLLMAQSRGNSPAVNGVLDEENSGNETDIVSMDDIISYE